MSGSIARHAVINDRYEIQRQIGSGSFGTVYLVKDVQNGGAPLAVKMERKGEKAASALRYEYRVYGALGRSKCQHVGRVFCYGVYGSHNFVVMELFGESMEQRLSRLGGALRHTTAMWLMQQMLTALRAMHGCYFVHRDVKPQNFVTAREGPPRLVLIDMGLAKRYRTPGLEHIDCRTGRNLTGTVRYTSLNIHRGLEPSRRDDLESLIYVGVYLMRGALPWQGLRNKCKADKYIRIGEIKLSLSPEQLTVGLPSEMELMLRYVQGMQFSAKPDYDYLSDLIRSFLVRENAADGPPSEWLCGPECS